MDWKLVLALTAAALAGAVLGQFLIRVVLGW
jgi:hypothetical protein